MSVLRKGCKRCGLFVNFLYWNYEKTVGVIERGMQVSLLTYSSTHYGQFSVAVQVSIIYMYNVYARICHMPHTTHHTRWPQRQSPMSHFPLAHIEIYVLHVLCVLKYRWASTALLLINMNANSFFGLWPCGGCGWRVVGIWCMHKNEARPMLYIYLNRSAHVCISAEGMKMKIIL